MNFIKKSAILTATLIMLISGAVQASVTVGINQRGGGDTWPFSGFASGGGVEYQQIFSSKAFSGPMAINKISMYLDTAGLMDSASYKLSLSTTSKAVGGLDISNISNNLGSNNALFGIFILGGNTPEVLNFSGTTFNYVPTDGNLLLDVVVFNVTKKVGYFSSGLQSTYNGSLTSMLSFHPSFIQIGIPNGITTANYGLMTTFDSVSAVPEPKTYAMLLAGLGLMGFTLRRKTS